MGSGDPLLVNAAEAGACVTHSSAPLHEAVFDDIAHADVYIPSQPVSGDAVLLFASAPNGNSHTNILLYIS